LKVNLSIELDAAVSLISNRKFFYSIQSLAGTFLSLSRTQKPPSSFGSGGFIEASFITSPNPLDSDMFIKGKMSDR